MSLPARLQFSQDEKLRTVTRRKLRLGSVLGGSGHEVTIHDLSVAGFCIETSANLNVGEALQVEIPEARPTRARVIWREGRFFGCEFAVRIPAAAVSASLLRSAVVPTESQSKPHAEITHDISDEAYEEDQYSLRTKFLVIAGVSVALWVVIGLAITSAI